MEKIARSRTFLPTSKEGIKTNRGTDFCQLQIPRCSVSPYHTLPTPEVTLVAPIHAVPFHIPILYPIISYSPYSDNNCGPRRSPGDTKCDGFTIPFDFVPVSLEPMNLDVSLLAQLHPLWHCWQSFHHTSIERQFAGRGQWHGWTMLCVHHVYQIQSRKLEGGFELHDISLRASLAKSEVKQMNCSLNKTFLLSSLKVLRSEEQKL